MHINKKKKEKKTVSRMKDRSGEELCYRSKLHLRVSPSRNVFFIFLGRVALVYLYPFSRERIESNASTRFSSWKSSVPRVAMRFLFSSFLFSFLPSPWFSFFSKEWTAEQRGYCSDSDVLLMAVTHSGVPAVYRNDVVAQPWCIIISLRSTPCANYRVRY